MTRTCDQCGKHLVTHRKGARFCDENCKNVWHNENRRKDDPPGKRLTPASGAVGSRGGNVRSVQEARELQTASKELDRWRLVMEVQIHRTLFNTGAFHVDDLDPLELPAEAHEVRGTLVNAVRQSGVMESTGVYRKVAHAAANARKAPIYRITAKGRRELPKLLAGVGIDHPEGTTRSHASSSESGTLDRPGGSPFTANGAGSAVDVDSGEQSSAGHRTKDLGGGEPSGGPALKGGGQSPESSGSVPGKGSSVVNRGTAEEPNPSSKSEPLSLLPEPPNMFDPDQRKAA